MLGRASPGERGIRAAAFHPFRKVKWKIGRGGGGERSDEFLDLSRKSRDPSRCKGESFGSIEIFKLKFRLVIGLRKFFIV